MRGGREQLPLRGAHDVGSHPALYILRLRLEPGQQPVAAIGIEFVQITHETGGVGGFDGQLGYAGCRESEGSERVKE